MSIADKVKQHKGKIFGGLVGSGSLIVLAMNLMNDKVDLIQQTESAKEQRIMTEVEYKHQLVLSELKFISTQIKETNNKIDRLEQRFYDKEKSYSSFDLNKEEKSLTTNLGG